MPPRAAACLLLAGCPALAACAKRSRNSAPEREGNGPRPSSPRSKTALQVKLRRGPGSVTHAAGSHHSQAGCRAAGCSARGVPAGATAQLYLQGPGHFTASIWNPWVSGNHKKLCTFSKRSETIYILSFLGCEKSIYLCCSVDEIKAETTAVCAYNIRVRKEPFQPHLMFTSRLSPEHPQMLCKRVRRVITGPEIVF